MRESAHVTVCDDLVHLLVLAKAGRCVCVVKMLPDAKAAAGKETGSSTEQGSLFTQGRLQSSKETALCFVKCQNGM